MSVKKILVTVAVAVFALATGVGLGVKPVAAANEFNTKACSSITDAGQREALGCDQTAQAPNVVINLLKVVIGVVGVVAVVLIIVAGQRYITAQGDPGQIQQAKNMIVYSIMGLVIAVLAFAIVVFVEDVVLGG